MSYVNYLTTEYPNIFFEDSKVGRMKKRIWDASEGNQEILDDYGIGSPEMGVAGTYIQNTPRSKRLKSAERTTLYWYPSDARKPRRA